MHSTNNSNIVVGVVVVIIVIVFIIFIIWLVATKEAYEPDKYEPVSDLKAELTDDTDDCKSNIEISWVYPPPPISSGDDDGEKKIEPPFIESDNITFSYYIGYPSKSRILSNKTIYKPFNNEWYYKKYIPGTVNYNHTLTEITLDKDVVDYKIVMYVTTTDVTKRPRAKDAEPAYSDEFRTTNKNNCNDEEVTTCKKLLHNLKNKCPDSFPGGFPGGVGSLKYKSVPYVDTDKSMYQLDSKSKTSIIISWDYSSSTKSGEDIQFNYNITEDGSATFFLDSWVTTNYDSSITDYNATINNVALVVDKQYRMVMYVSSSKESNHQDSDKTYSSIFKVKESVTTEPTLTINKTGNKPITYTVGDNSESVTINWTVNCNSYNDVYKNMCPSEFIFSVDVEGNDTEVNGSNPTLLFPFYYLSKNGDTFRVTLDDGSSGNTEYTGTLRIDSENYTFTIDNLLPVGYTYDVVVTMYRWTGVYANYKDEYDIYENTANKLFKVILPVTPAGTITVDDLDNGSYAFGNSIECSWSDSDDGNTQSYNIGIYTKSGNTYNSVVDSVHTVTKSTPLNNTFTYSKIYKFTCDDTCKNNNGIQLSDDGIKYYIGVEACSDTNGITCGELSYNTTSFIVVECNIIGGTDSCSTSLSETTLLRDDSYARIAYETNCSYADNIELCMFDQGYHEFDQREISTTCKSYNDDKGESKSVCARTECPPMSVPYTTDGVNFTAGCTTPLNINSDITGNKNFDYSFNKQPDNEAVSYQSTRYGDIDYGYPFIAIIEGGTSDTDAKEPVYNSSDTLGLTSTSQKIAVPGMIDGNKVLLMPVALQNFHPFIAWRTFGAINSLTNMVPWFLYLLENNNKMYSLYHIGSLKYLDTNTKTCKTSDGTGLSCQLTLKNLTDIKSYIRGGNSHPYICKSQPATGSDINACTTSSIWLDNVDAKFNRDYNSSDRSVTISKTDPIPGTEISTSSNNWNTPIGTNQTMVFFGDKTDTSGSLYYKNKSSNNTISHMRRWYIGDKKDTNSYFWKSGLGKVPAGNAPSIDYVYKVLAEQWPNGPPYSPPTDRGTKVINFSTPIQYGIVPSYQQTNFYLEAYSWDSNYKTFKGLGFISNKGTNRYLGTLSNDDGVNKFKIWTNPINVNGVVTINYISPIGTNYYMYYSYNDVNNKNPEYMKFLLSLSFVGKSRTTINILKNGYITMNSTDTNLFTSNVTYILCVKNDKYKDLYWVLSGTALMTENNQDFISLDSINFTPIMLAMSWPSPP
jgi:hypothetical protein